MQYTLITTREFDHWLDTLSAKAKSLVLNRLRLLEQGHMGLYRVLGEGLVELKWKNGLRVYFIRIEARKLKILLGGDKHGQNKDIQKARSLY